jgi:hypothetical protein
LAPIPGALPVEVLELCSMVIDGQEARLDALEAAMKIQPSYWRPSVD